MNRQLTMNNNFRDIRLLQRIALFVCCFALIAGQARTEESKEQTEPDQQTVTEHNPIFPGKCADPEVLFSRKTGKVYVYPTSDKNGFCVYSSDNLVDWDYNGLVLKNEDITWGNKDFWAPSIIEKEIDGQFKYFFYFCADLKIGVATGDDPTGPFVDSGQPLINSALHPEGVFGIEIDPYVFSDPVSGKNYLYWGNSYLAVAELNADMISVNRETIRLITPTNFFEGTYVFYRNGRYYLTWSKNDTRSVDYQVWVATSDSPLGPFVSPEKDTVILSKIPEQGIYGPGHHSFLFLPGSDKQYIFYHRLCTPLNPGSWDRETCIDLFYFNEDGSIKPIIPTRQGISQPVKLPELPDK